jgi:hypothetical protein
VTYRTEELEHIDTRRGRSMSLPYLKREFLWYCRGDRYDTRIQDYAPLWKSCVGIDGGINSNYGQYLFTEAPGFDVPFFHQLDLLVDDPDSRRCWLPLYQEWHNNPGMFHPEVPCTIGMGFVVRDTMLHMSVHMRSQDLWHGTPYDEGTAYLFQLMAVTYLTSEGLFVQPGAIVHTVDSPAPVRAAPGQGGRCDRRPSDAGHPRAVPDGMLQQRVQLQRPVDPAPRGVQQRASVPAVGVDHGHRGRLRPGGVAVKHVVFEGIDRSASRR